MKVSKMTDKKLTPEQKKDIKEFVQSNGIEAVVWNGDKYYSPFTGENFNPEDLNFSYNVGATHFAYCAMNNQSHLHHSILDVQAKIIESDYKKIPEFETSLPIQKLKDALSKSGKILLLSSFIQSHWPYVVNRAGVYLRAREEPLKNSEELEEMRYVLSQRKEGSRYGKPFYQRDINIIFYNYKNARWEDYFENKGVEEERIIPLGFPVDANRPNNSGYVLGLRLDKREMNGKYLLSIGQKLERSLISLKLDGITNCFIGEMQNEQKSAEGKVIIPEKVVLDILQPCFLLNSRLD